MKRQAYAFGLAFAALLFCQTVNAAPPNWPESIDARIAEARKAVDTIDMEAYVAVVKNPNGALLVDVREGEEYDLGSIPGTINVSRGLLEMRIWKPLGYPGTVDMNRKIYVSCASGGRAVLATKTLKDIGFTNVTAAPFNLVEWQKKGYPFKSVEQK
jgi:rhodanese-related sulfurtransferase